MATNIKIDDNPYQEKLITLNGESLYLTIMYNTSDDYLNNGTGSWYFDLANRNKEPLLSGVKILPFQKLTGKYLHVNSVLKGGLWCVNTKDTTSNIKRDNFGTGREFQLWYISEEEATSLGI